MFKLYDIIYFRIYRLIRQINDEAPEFVSIIALSLFMIVQIGAIFSISVNYYPILKEFATSNTGGIIGAGIIIFNFIYFLYNNHYLKVIERYNVNLAHDGVKSILLILYFIIMVCVFILTL